MSLMLPLRDRGERLVAAYIAAWYAGLVFLVPLGGIWFGLVNFGYFGIGVVAVLATWRAGDASGDPEMRIALRRMAVAHAIIVLNGSAWTAWPYLFGREFPPDVGALADLAYVPVLVIALVRLPADPAFNWRDGRTRVDGLLFAVGALVLSWHFVVLPEAARGTPLLEAVLRAVDVSVMLAASFAMLRARDARVREVLGWVLAANMLYIVTGYFWTRFATAYAPGHWIDGFWFLVWIMRWEAARRAARPLASRAAPGRDYRGTLAPSLFVAAAYALLLVAYALESGERSVEVAIAAAIMTVLLIIRQGLLLRENSDLSAQTARQAAVFRTLVASASDLVLLVREDRRIAYASPSAQRALGELTGLTFAELLHPADRDGALEWLDERTTSLGMRAYRCRVRAADGAWRDMELRAQDRREDPVIEGFVINARDVTHEAALEQALGHSRKLAMLSEMAGRIAHSFNNTLAALQAHAEELARDLPPGSVAQEDATAIGAAAERGAGITRQLLGFSGRHVIRPEPLRPAEVVESLRPTLAKLLGPSRPCVVAAEDPDATVLLDRAQLEQVLVNLVANARDAMPGPGTVTIRVAREEATAPGTRRVAIEVADEGSGIPEELLPRVLEPFFSTKAPGRGTGLGLAMVASIIRRAGGAVDLRSTVGVGTTVRITLPSHRPVNAPAPASSAAPAAPAESARVLLVDDDALVRRASARMLQRAGYAVIDAADGARALAIAEDGAERIDLLLTDLMMPGISGREVISRFRALRPGTPIVCVTGYATERDDDRSLALEVSAIIAKPFTSAALQAALADALRRARAPRA